MFPLNNVGIPPMNQGPQRPSEKLLEQGIKVAQMQPKGTFADLDKKVYTGTKELEDYALKSNIEQSNALVATYYSNRDRVIETAIDQLNGFYTKGSQDDKHNTLLFLGNIFETTLSQTQPKNPGGLTGALQIARSVAINPKTVSLELQKIFANDPTSIYKYINEMSNTQKNVLYDEVIKSISDKDKNAFMDTTLIEGLKSNTRRGQIETNRAKANMDYFDKEMKKTTNTVVDYMVSKYTKDAESMSGKYKADLLRTMVDSDPAGFISDDDTDTKNQIINSWVKVQLQGPNKEFWQKAANEGKSRGFVPIETVEKFTAQLPFIKKTPEQLARQFAEDKYDEIFQDFKKTYAGDSVFSGGKSFKKASFTIGTRSAGESGGTYKYDYDLSTPGLRNPNFISNNVQLKQQLSYANSNKSLITFESDMNVPEKDNPEARELLQTFLKDYESGLVYQRDKKFKKGADEYYGRQFAPRGSYYITSTAANNKDWYSVSMEIPEDYIQGKISKLKGKDNPMKEKWEKLSGKTINMFVPAEEAPQFEVSFNQARYEDKYPFVIDEFKDKGGKAVFQKGDDGRLHMTLTTKRFNKEGKLEDVVDTSIGNRLADYNPDQIINMLTSYFEATEKENIEMENYINSKIGKKFDKKMYGK